MKRIPTQNLALGLIALTLPLGVMLLLPMSRPYNFALVSLVIACLGISLYSACQYLRASLGRRHV